MRYASTVLAVLARTTHVPAAHAAFTQHADSLDLAQNPFLDAATWTRLWKAHKQRDWRLALVQHALDDTRRDLVIRREHDVPLLVLFILANPTLTGEQQTRIRTHPTAQRGDRAVLASAFRQARTIVEIPITPFDPLLPHARETCATTTVYYGPGLLSSKAVHYAIYLSHELCGDPIETWTAAITLLDDGYTGTYGDLVATSRALTRPPRAISLTPTADAPSRGRHA